MIAINTGESFNSKNVKYALKHLESTKLDTSSITPDVIKIEEEYITLEIEQIDESNSIIEEIKEEIYRPSDVKLSGTKEVGKINLSKFERKNRIGKI